MPLCRRFLRRDLRLLGFRRSVFMGTTPRAGHYPQDLREPRSTAVLVAGSIVDQPTGAPTRWRSPPSWPSWPLSTDEDFPDVEEEKLLAAEAAAEAAAAAPSPLDKARIPSGLRVDVFARDKYRCVMCGRAASDGVVLHADHIVSESHGGEATMGNLQTLCADCNVGKGNRYTDDLRG